MASKSTDSTPDTPAEVIPTPTPALPPDGPAEDDDSPVALRYVGDGDQHFRGVPPRDLTKDEAAVIKRDHPDLFAVMTRPATGSPLYERVKEHR